MGATKPLGLGLIGCGAFGRFCLESFATLPDVRIAAVADVVAAAADSLARHVGVPSHHDPAALIARDDVDIVHVATPPSTHHELGLAAIRSGKHLLCEKPLAVNVRQADELLAAARAADRLATVNFVLRYNGVVDAVKAILDSGAIGRVLAARLTNCAGDTPLTPTHWFWDKRVSGGIFVEHGVHFFDLYAHWLGPGRVVSAHAECRENTGQEDRVTCVVRHDAGAIASHYHGFDQLSLMDRTDHRLVCQRGDVRVDGWIPLSLHVDAAVDDEGLAALAHCCAGRCDVRTVEEYDERRGTTIGRNKPCRVTRRVHLDCTPADDKQGVYADSVRRLLADQIAYARDHAHVRRIAESNGRDALAMAEAAADLAAAGAA